MPAASVLFRRAVVAGVLLGGLSAFAAGSNDPDLLGAWKGTGADAQWVVNFMPNDTYQFRLGDSPTGSRGGYVAHNGKLELHEGHQKNKTLSGSYRVEGCNVLVLTLPTGTARMDRRGSVPTGGCGKSKAASTAAQAPGGVFSSLGTGTVATGNAATATTARQAPVSGASPKSIAVPDTSKAAASVKASAQKSAQQSATAAKATTQQAATSATAEGTNAVKAGAAAFWTQAKGLSKSAVQAGGKAAKTVGTKAQEAGKAVAKTFKGTAGQADTAVDEAAARAKSQGD